VLHGGRLLEAVWAENCSTPGPSWGEGWLLDMCFKYLGEDRTLAGTGLLLGVESTVQLHLLLHWLHLHLPPPDYLLLPVHRVLGIRAIIWLLVKNPVQGAQVRMSSFHPPRLQLMVHVLLAKHLLRSHEKLLVKHTQGARGFLLLLLFLHVEQPQLLWRLIELGPIPRRAVVEHGIEHHNAHDVLVKVEAQPVKFSRASVKNQGVEVDPPNFDKLHDAVSKLSNRQLFHLGLDWYKEVTLEAGVGSSTKHIFSNILLNIPRVVDVVHVPQVVDVVHVPWSVVLPNIPMEVHTLHVPRETVLVHISMKVAAQVALQQETTLLHVDSVVLLHAAGNNSLSDDVLLQTALEVVLPHALNVLVVADVKALLLFPISRVLLPRVGKETTSILTLCHPGTAHCNSLKKCIQAV